MNSLLVSGKVIQAAPDVQQRACGLVCNFRIAIDSRSGKRPTEATISCFDELARIGHQLAVGERVAIMGSLGHMSGRGLVIAANQIARMGPDLSRDVDDAAPDSSGLSTSGENS